jgi:hypothetical protein
MNLEEFKKHIQAEREAQLKKDANKTAQIAKATRKS